VLVRSSGEHTYFASDIAYHQDKRERGFERLVDVWGADHHGYVKRMKAAFAALGADPGKLDLLIMQFVNLVRGGQPVSMSKRAGEFVTLDDLVDLIGVDAARWYLLARSHETTIEVDVEVATRESADNPVYYVQYAHARIAGILDKAAGPPDATLAGALEPPERALVKKLVAFPAEVGEAADRRAPHRIANYALELARDFTGFYEHCKVLTGTDHETFRLGLCFASQRVLARSLDLLGVEAPDSM
jgi:arginyl-tRNA synthetase